MKDVTVADLHGIDNLICVSEETKKTWRSTIRWITDVSMYSSVPRPEKIFRSRLQKKDLEIMEQRGLSKVFQGSPLGTVDTFAVIEAAKTRRRRIGHTVSINDALDKSTLAGLHLPTRKEQLEQGLGGKFSLCLDFSAYFDAFEVCEGVQQFYVFKAVDELRCLTRLPMGQRQSVDVAQATTNVLLDFDYGPDVTSQSCIDNVRFIGPRKSVVRAALQFINRCNQANLRLNDIRQYDKDIEQQLLEIAVSRHVWLGIEYDLETKQVRVGPKSIEKLARVAACVEGTSPAVVVASLYGLVMFCASVLHSNMARRFNAMRFLRDFSTDVQQDPTRWKQEVTLPIGVAADLREWVQELLANKFRHITSPEDTPILTLMVDASGWGWGAIVVSEDTGTVQQASAPWSPQEKIDYKTEDSVHSEPLGAYKALCRFAKFHPNPKPPTVKILTDNVSCVAAINTGYAKSFIINKIANRIRSDFYFLNVVAEHIPGVTNRADALSRGAHGAV